MEATHLKEKSESQDAFKSYKAQIEQKEKQIEETHRKKLDDMKLEVMDLKKGFDNRCQEFKKQIEEFK